MFDSKEAVLEAVYGKWGKIYRKRLIERDREKYYTLLAAREFHDYITEIDVRAEHLYEETLNELKVKKHVTPSLKESNPRLWQKRMTDLEKQARELVYNTVILADELNKEKREK